MEATIYLRNGSYLLLVLQLLCRDAQSSGIFDITSDQIVVCAEGAQYENKMYFFTERAEAVVIVQTFWNKHFSLEGTAIFFFQLRILKSEYTHCMV